MEKKLLTIVFVTTCLASVSSVPGDDLLSENQDEGDHNVVAPGLFPHVFNLATRARITSNATCGEARSEIYCRLVEHVPDPKISFPQCRVCDLNSDQSDERHPIEHAIDGTNNWWQSPSIANGMQYHWVSVTLDLGQVFEVAYVILKAANSPRPGNWILEKSIDGVTFEPWQYYAISHAECLRAYGKVGATRMESFRADDEVICTTYYSNIEPLRDGEIHTSLINGRPSAMNPSQLLMEFMSARFIRFRFQRIRTLNADLMSPLYNTPEDTTDTIVSRRYFYSIKDISVGGHCICNGHALECVAHSSSSAHPQVMRCVCQHNTCGESCNECCPGYNQKGWKQGDHQRSFACEACNCHNHADDCYYDPRVEADGLSLDAESVYSGGGVCIDCRDQTTGINCERCMDGYYRHEGVLPEYPVPCTECGCDPVGTIPYTVDPSLPTPCIKDDKQIDIGVMPGSCACKEGYSGMKCNRCARGYRGYPHCQPCPCNAAGSVNEDPCEGPCVCKPNVQGDFCDRCVDGTFNLNERDPLGCTACFCFGVTTHCTSVPWPIEKIRKMDNWFLTRLDMMGYAYPRRISTYAILADHETISQELASQEYYFMAPKEYVDNKLTSYGGIFQFTLSWRTNYDIPASNITRKVVLILEGHNTRIARWFSRNPVKREDTITLFMTEDSWYHIPRSVNPLEGTPGPPTGTPVDQAEFMNVIRGVRRFLIGALQYPPQISVLLKDVKMEVVVEDSRSPELLKSVEECSCPSTYEGLSCESCKDGFRRSGGIIYGGDCEVCSCHGHSSTCDDYTGECVNCQHDTHGPHCEFCASGHYGNATNGSPADCLRCACPLVERPNNFSPTCVADEGSGGYICDRCPMGYQGDRCERCEDGYFGNPLVLGDYCKPCFVNCNGNIDPAIPGNCDAVTGQCLQCVNHTAGFYCENCEDGYYGDAGMTLRAKFSLVQNKVRSVISGLTPNCIYSTSGHVGRSGFWNVESGNGCQSCDCNPTGSADEICDVITGHCHCKEGISGSKCDQCEIGYWNFSAAGCQACECDRGLCDPSTGQCVCPPNTIGPACKDCPSNTWTSNPLQGCMPCNCSAVGSVKSQCNKETGQCRCRKPYIGQLCDQCPSGYVGFPDCQTCKCSGLGTDPSTCRGKRCKCSTEGQCFCKQNVRGSRCNKCKSGFFGLESKLLLGCTSCFCFGVTSDCDRANYVYTKLKLDSDSVSQIYVSDLNETMTTRDGIVGSNSDVRTNLSHVASLLGTWDIYWSLPPSFLGSKEQDIHTAHTVSTGALKHLD
ncbi:putative laminin subunit alpha-2-like [Apostichopus japonicus]|uniref:Putative laminin subunit alpha-2-like n=1 Tax=Stichopus japonicus TaxID=307972 RepID=A0A2G8KFX1_STIJA|nr:putative laminin subunit alpha-2-like [Apostichopus japonicus]